MATFSYADVSLPDDLTELSLEALMSIEVTTASRRSEKLSNTAAAVYVITQDDIQRSTATNIPDLLRMVPGLQVAKSDANKWAISSRGFNGRFANKLLVLMDGRTVYSPLFSGVFWDAQDTVLEDIERIEIIRGPGATLWGANAVNGVINILTKKSEETQGVLLSGGAGSEEKAFGTVRYGGVASDRTHYRFYTKYFNRDHSVDADGSDSADQWYQWRSGFRIDNNPDPENYTTLQGDIYQGNSGETMSYPSAQMDFPFFTKTTRDHANDVFGGNLLGRWQHSVSNSSELALQAYYDRSTYSFTIIDSKVDTFDIDFQHSFQPLQRHAVIYGVGYRYSYDHVSGSYSASLDPESRNYDLISAFLQDDITLVPRHWRLTVGTKFENNDFSGTEWQPSVRLLWTPNDRHSLWGAVSRAVRTPSRGETANRVKMIISDELPYLSETLKSPDFDSEEVISYELGYRIQPVNSLSVDIATFYNCYEKLRVAEFQQIIYNSPPTPIVLPISVENSLAGDSYGIEAAIDWRPAAWWRVQLAYNYLELDLNAESDSGEITARREEGSSPKHQLSFRSFLDVSETWQLDFWLRHVDELAAIKIDSYTELDVRLNWQIRSNIAIALVGQNLLQRHHPEYVSEYLDTRSTEMQRGFYGKVTLKF